MKKASIVIIILGVLAVVAGWQGYAVAPAGQYVFGRLELAVGRWQLAKATQRACGKGGRVKNGQIEIQGDKRAEVARILSSIGLI